MFDEELVGIHEIAEMAGVSSQAVVNWRTRHPNFPEPEAELRAGPVFRRGQVRAWLRKRKVPMTKVISTINLKGGVAKTTTTVAVAEILAGAMRKRVLLIDLDPQTNATVMILGDDRWKELNDAGYTLAQMFKAAIDPEKHKFDLDGTLQRNASGIRDVRRLSLLPSSLDLISVQDRIAMMPSGQFYAQRPTDILRRELRPVIEDFDYVLIDCPPSLGLVTLNGLRISSHYLIPTIPDLMSTYGIPQILGTVESFSEEVGEPIEPLGIVITKYRAQSRVHQNQTRLMRSTYPERYGVPVFDSVVPESNEVAQAVERRTVNTLRQRWGYQGQYNVYERLAREIVGKLEVVEEPEEVRA